MTPLTENPTLVLQVSKDGTAVIRSANNVDRDLRIILVPDKESFDAEASNQPFNSTIDLGPQQVMSSVASKARYAASGK